MMSQKAKRNFFIAFVCFLILAYVVGVLAGWFGNFKDPVPKSSIIQKDSAIRYNPDTVIVLPRNTIILDAPDSVDGSIVSYPFFEIKYSSKNAINIEQVNIGGMRLLLFRFNNVNSELSIFNYTKDSLETEVLKKQILQLSR